MKVTFVIKKNVKKHDIDSLATIYVRIRDGRKFDSIAPSQLTINPNLWDTKTEGVKSKVICSQDERVIINEGVRALKTFIEKEYRDANTDAIEKDWLKQALYKYYHPEKYKAEDLEKEKPSFFELFDEFLLKHRLSDIRKKNFKVIRRRLERFELFVHMTKRGQKDFQLDVDLVSADTLHELWIFFEFEYKYYQQYPSLYKHVPENRIPAPRGRNTLIDNFCRLRTFFLWCYENKKTTNKPFDQFPMEEAVYGTPYYITIEERNQLYHTNLKNHPQLAIQRDIFVFQCLIGCRVGDLLKMTKANIISGAIEYIPKKTKEGRPLTVRVPLNTTAKEILERYADTSDKLLPFISEQKYNVAIKRIFLAARLNRMVTIINPTTREEEKRPLNEIASSHIARRCFVGNLYKQVKDPNLVGALSGHKEGSKAFARYREIDEDMKKELVNLLM
jgi:integrase